MKKKIIILLSVVIILLIGIVVWFNIPLDLMDLDPNEVMEIVVFNGNSGNATHITDKEQIQHIVENLNGVEVKRSKPSLGYMGYSFKVTIYLSDGNEAGDWNNFIINSDDTIRKDPFFYSVTKGVCASCGASFPVSRRKLHDRECCVTSFRQGGYTPLRR